MRCHIAVAALVLLAGAPGFTSPPQDDDVAELPPLEEQPQGGGRLEISSDPPGADVLLDGAAVGRTPLLLTGVPAGAHHVSIVRGGVVVLRQRVQVASGRTTRLAAPVRARATRPPARAAPIEGVIKPMLVIAGLALLAQPLGMAVGVCAGAVCNSPSPREFPFVGQYLGEAGDGWWVVRVASFFVFVLASLVMHAGWLVLFADIIALIVVVLGPLISKSMRKKSKRAKRN